MAGMAVMGFIIVYGSHRWVRAERRKYVAMAMAIFMFVQEVLDRSLHHYVYGDLWRNTLPLQICGMSVVLTIVLLITRKKPIFDLLYFWGIGGAGMAILTPEQLFPFPHILNLTYFWSHALIIIGVAFMMVNYGYRPYFKSFVHALVLTNLYIAVMIPVNIALDTNYLYLCAKPKGATPVDFLGPWPWYILGLELLGAGIFFILYSPYLVMDRLGSKTEIAEGSVAASE